MRILFDSTSLTIAKALAGYAIDRAPSKQVMGLIETEDSLWAMLYDGTDYELVSGKDSLPIETKNATKLLLKVVRGL